MFTLVYKIFATGLLCFLVALPINMILASDSVNPEILDTNGKTPYATYNSCGGVLETKCDELIIIEYKPDEEYENNEFCIWTIRNKNCQGLLITKLKSGFEVGYDYIQISGFESVLNLGDGPTFTESVGSTTIIEQISKRAYLFYLIFSSDGSNTGSGFRIQLVGFTTQGSPRWSDDFFSASPSGFTLLIPYPQRMIQSFVIAPKHTSVQSIFMDVHYYTVGNDYLAVFTLERNGQSINFRTHSNRLNGTGLVNFEASYYTNFVILFYSYQSTIPEDAGVELNWASAENVITTENYI